MLVHISQKDPQSLEIYQKDFIDTILISNNQSVLRNLVNTSQRLPLIEYKESEYLNKLIDFISDDTNKVALFVYSIYKLIQFTKKYPDLKIEIESIISLKEVSTMKPAMRIGIRNYLAKTAI